MEAEQAPLSRRVADFRPLAWEQIPDLGLYMDQVTTFVQRHFQPLYPGVEKIVTPSMVNNYVKFGLISRPVGKKYGREQLAQLLMICTLKHGASAESLKRLLTVDDGETLESLYAGFCACQLEVCAALDAAPPSPMGCAMRSSAYRLLCGAVLAALPATHPQKGDNAHDPPQP